MLVYAIMQDARKKATGCSQRFQVYINRHQKPPINKWKWRIWESDGHTITEWIAHKYCGDAIQQSILYSERRNPIHSSSFLSEASKDKRIWAAILTYSSDNAWQKRWPFELSRTINWGKPQEGLPQFIDYFVYCMSTYSSALSIFPYSMCIMFFQVVDMACIMLK